MNAFERMFVFFAIYLLFFVGVLFHAVAMAILMLLSCPFFLCLFAFPLSHLSVLPHFQLSHCSQYISFLFFFFWGVECIVG